MAKTYYYKLSTAASVFYDPKNKLKITNGVPGTTDSRTKKTIDAERGGHIIAISAEEYSKMLGTLPAATAAAIKAEVPKPKVAPKKVEEEKEEEEEADENEVSDERQALIERLDALQLSKKEYKKAIKLNDSDLEDYLIEVE